MALLFYRKGDEHIMPVSIAEALIDLTVAVVTEVIGEFVD
jgi:hypothetical protein